MRGIPGSMEHPACHPRWLQARVWASAGPSFCSGSPRPWNRCLSSAGCVGSRGCGAPGSQLPWCRGRLLAAAFPTPTFSRFQRSKKQWCLRPRSTQCWEQDTPPAGSLWLGWVRTTPSQHLLPPPCPPPPPCPMKQTHTSSGWDSKQSTPPSSRHPPQGPYPVAVLSGLPRGVSVPVQMGGVCVLTDAALVLMNSHL